MIGYLIGVPRIDLVWGRSVWVPLAGHAVDRTYGAEVYRDLYAALSPSWVCSRLLSVAMRTMRSSQPRIDQRWRPGLL